MVEPAIQSKTTYITVGKRVSICVVSHLPRIWLAKWNPTIIPKWGPNHSIFHFTGTEHIYLMKISNFCDP